MVLFVKVCVESCVTNVSVPVIVGNIIVPLLSELTTLAFVIPVQSPVNVTGTSAGAKNCPPTPLNVMT